MDANVRKLMLGAAHARMICKKRTRTLVGVTANPLRVQHCQRTVASLILPRDGDMVHHFDPFCSDALGGARPIAI